VIGAVAGLLVAAATRPMYTATARSFVSTSSASVSDLQQGAASAPQAAASYSAAARSSAVLQGVIDDLHLATTPEALAGRVTARAVPDAVVLEIDVTDPSAIQAARIANAVQDRLGRVVAPSAQQRTAVTAIQRAVPPAAPSTPDVPVDGVVGALGGAAAWLLVALVRALRRWRPSPPDGLAAPSML
jgi:capsular polysaccharide biosynthesis protein